MAREFRCTGQRLNDDKCEVICDNIGGGDADGHVRAWGAADLHKYESGGLPSRLQTTDGPRVRKMKQVREMVVLGSCVVLNEKESSETALRHRFREAWHSWHILRDQLTSKATPLKLLVALSDTTFMASLLWGLETANLGKKRRNKMSALQSVCVMRMLKLCKRPEEDHGAFLRRRARVATSTIARHSRGKWGEIQRYRFLGILGACLQVVARHAHGGQC